MSAGDTVCVACSEESAHTELAGCCFLLGVWVDARRNSRVLGCLLLLVLPLDASHTLPLVLGDMCKAGLKVPLLETKVLVMKTDISAMQRGARSTRTQGVSKIKPESQKGLTEITSRGNVSSCHVLWIRADLETRSS